MIRKLVYLVLAVFAFSIVVLNLHWIYHPSERQIEWALRLSDGNE